MLAKASQPRSPTATHAPLRPSRSQRQCCQAAPADQQRAPVTVDQRRLRWVHKRHHVKDNALITPSPEASLKRPSSDMADLFPLDCVSPTNRRATHPDRIWFVVQKSGIKRELSTAKLSSYRCNKPLLGFLFLKTPPSTPSTTSCRSAPTLSCSFISCMSAHDHAWDSVVSTSAGSCQAMTQPGTCFSPAQAA